jgi:hypothetical protein
MRGKLQTFLALLLAVLMHTSAVAQARQRPGGATPGSGSASRTDDAPPSASEAFGLLRDLVTDDSVQWYRSLASAHLAPWQGHDGMWRLIRSDGEVRVRSAFGGRARAASVELYFFPTARVPIAEATLSWMYRTMTAYTFDGGDGIELQFPEETTTFDTGHVHRSFLVSLTTNAFMRTTVTVDWTRGP